MSHTNLPPGDDKHKKQRIFWRTVVMAVFMGGFLFIPLFVQLFNLQIVRHEELLEKAARQQTRDVTVSADRGTIYDSEGNILAVSATVQDLLISPKDILDRKLDKTLIATGLSEITGVDAGKILKEMEKTSAQHQYIKRQIEKEEEERIRTFIDENNLDDGVYLEPTSKRYYPYSSLASHVVGFVGAENKGLYGVEMIYDDVLSGQDGRVVTAKTGRGVELLTKYENIIDAQDGLDVHLTINATIQGFAEKALREGIEKYDVQNGGFCIVMDPNTGGILAMASSLGYDLNNYRTIVDPVKAAELEAMKNDPAVSENDYLKALGAAQTEQWRNRCVNDTYEPGSTFKTITLSAALEEGAVSLNSQFDCSGSKTVAGRTIHCAKRVGHGHQDLTLAVKNSCNPAFMEIAFALGAPKFYDYFEAFGLKNTTGIDLNGEGTSVIWTRDFFQSEEGIQSVATASFGQTLKVTPIQLITAASAVVNGGHLLKPHVLDYTAQADGTVVEKYQTTEVRQVISEKTSETVRNILEQVVATGTGKNTYQPGYRIGGKTGTSENTEKQTKDYIVSFLGVAPANDPQVVILLAYDKPLPASPGSTWTAGGTYISGGNMAAPMAGPLLRDILDYLGVEKQYTAEELARADTTVPYLTGYDEATAATLLEERGLTYRKVGEGDKVTGQVPAGAAVIPGGSQVVLYMGEDAPGEQVEVPDLTGLGPDGAKQALAQADLYMKGGGSAAYFTSATLAANQSIPPGTLVDRGTVVEVTFVENVTDFTGND